MRNLVIAEIKKLVDGGCSEIDVEHLQYLRGTKINYTGESTYTDLDKFLAQLYDPELLLILRDLHCEIYR